MRWSKRKITGRRRIGKPDRAMREEELMNMDVIGRLVVLIGLGLTAPAISAAYADTLYIGDDSDNTVKAFDASTGTYLGVFVNHNGCPRNPSSPPPAGCLYGPRGLIFDGNGHLGVADQNANLLSPNNPIAGAIFDYSATTGAFQSALIPYNASNAPPAPRGIILYGNTLFVASQSGLSPSSTGAPCQSGQPQGTGCLEAFDATTGEFTAYLSPPPASGTSFHPRSVVIGPDGLLYVSNDPVLGGLSGQVLRYDPTTLSFKDIFINVACVTIPCTFNRPEGLVFGPDGNLYITSFRASSKDTDKILIFAGPASQNPAPGTLITYINTDEVGQVRAYGQALLFGPGPTANHSYLFVPITTPTGSNSGQVRRYDVTDRSNVLLDIIVPNSSKQNSPLGLPVYLTFGFTSPDTLDYGPP
jgi:hypothetical protein